MGRRMEGRNYKKVGICDLLHDFENQKHGRQISVDII